MNTTVLLFHPNLAASRINARLAQPLDASSVDFCKWIDAANDASLHTFAHDEVGTRRRFAMV